MTSDEANLFALGIKFIFNILIIITLLISCKTTRILPDIPVTGNLPIKPERLSSQISLPMELDISSVETIINQKLPSGLIADDSKRDGNTTSYSYQVFRNKPVKFTAQGNDLIFKVPIDIQAHGSYNACIGFWRGANCCSTSNPFGSGCLTPGVTKTEHGDASPTVDIELRIRIELQEDYSIKAKTYLQGVLAGDTHLHIDLIGNLIKINIDIKDKLEKPLQKFVNDYQQQINTKVAELVKKFDIKMVINKYWEEIKKPIRMGDFWLDVQPQKVLFENLNAENGKLRIAVGFASKLQIVTTKPSTSSAPLPNLILQQNTKGEFNIYLLASTTFEFLEKELKNKVADKKTY